MHQSIQAPVEVWSVDDVATALIDVGRTLRAEQAVAAAAPARLCLRANCSHDQDGSWARPTAPRAVYTAHTRSWGLSHV